MPGGPISVRIAPDLRVGLDAAVLAQLAHGQVLGDPLLDVVEAGVVGVEHLTRVRPGRGAPRSAWPTARRSASRGRCGSWTTRPSARPCARAGRAPCSACSCDGLGHPGLGDLRAVLVDDRRVVLAELLADRLHLLAQEVLALLLLGARLDVVADALADLQLGQPLALQLDRQLEPLDRRRVVSQQLDLLLEVQSRASSRTCRPGRRARRSSAGTRRRGRRRRAARGSPRPPRGTRARARACGRRGASSGRSSTSTRSSPSGSVCGGADHAAVQRRRESRRARRRAAGRAPTPRRRRRPGVLVLVARDEKDALVVADVDRKVMPCSGRRRRRRGRSVSRFQRDSWGNNSK